MDNSRPFLMPFFLSLPFPSWRIIGTRKQSTLKTNFTVICKLSTATIKGNDITKN